MKSYTVVFTPRAERQLEQLYRYIADASGAICRQGHEACEALSTFPERGAKRDDLRPSLRTMGHAKSATIAFSVNAAKETVAIHGVFYGGQDFEHRLRETDNDD